MFAFPARPEGNNETSVRTVIPDLSLLVLLEGQECNKVEQTNRLRVTRTVPFA
jgi:hypothetical protein